MHRLQKIEQDDEKGPFPTTESRRTARSTARKEAVHLAGCVERVQSSKGEGKGRRKTLHLESGVGGIGDSMNIQLCL